MFKSGKSYDQNKYEDSKQHSRSDANFIKRIFNRHIPKRMKILLKRELNHSIFYRPSESTSSLVEQLNPQIQSLSKNIELNNLFYSDLPLYNIDGMKFDLETTIKVIFNNFWSFTENFIYVMSNVRRKRDLYRIRKIFNHFTSHGKYRQIMNEKIMDIFERLYNTKLEEIIQRVLQSNKYQKVIKKVVKFFDLKLKTFFIFYRFSSTFWKDSKKYCKNDIRFALNYIEVAKKFINILNSSEYLNFRILPVDDFLPCSFNADELNFLNSINSLAVEYFTNYVDSEKEIIPIENFTSNRPFVTSNNLNSNENFIPNNLDSNEEIVPKANFPSNQPFVTCINYNDEEIYFINYDDSYEEINPIEVDFSQYLLQYQTKKNQPQFHF